jgi:hypothetical protein
MALTKFVNNVEDLSEDGGYKFRFKCDRCGDGYESQFISSKSNLLKTAIDMFEVFRPLGLGNASKTLDRGLRGKERDAAYERAVQEAMVFFKKCPACGHWVCPDNCWNETSGMCDACAPESRQAAARETNRLEIQHAVAAIDDGKTQVHLVHCLVCGVETHGGKFCESCGAPLASAAVCKQCRQPLVPGSKFCGNCGGKSL